nr:helix-turn-helix domain-containing protein [Streptomyces chartreusis]
MLASLATPAGTTALAERAGVSVATASEHATVLRAAGLITTVRDGSRVLHALTPLGEALLAGG